MYGEVASTGKRETSERNVRRRDQNLGEVKVMYKALNINDKIKNKLIKKC